MKKYIIFMPMFIISLNLFAQKISQEYYLNNIEDDFIGVYLPIEYINSLVKTKNHSISMHLNNSEKYHDVLAVNKNIIYSNLKWHDQYAIQSNEGNLYTYMKIENDNIIVDNNENSYKKIGDDPSQYSSIVRNYVGNIIFNDVVEKKIGVYISDREIVIPFLYFFTGVDNYEIILDDMFYEKGSSILLYNRQRDVMVYLVINGTNYLFYDMKEDNDDMFNVKSNILFTYKPDEDIRIITALSGLSDHCGSEYLQYLNNLIDVDKRMIINTLFALNGYSFATDQWKIFFNNYSWYKPNKDIKNGAEILNDRQKMLLEYINNK
ncbi:hypothetical protein FACS189479_06930 [Spirochaetia bacterium]|nr:hypothetical protein FACS189479_06930 [Spirochaetia bacterium]